MDVNGEIFISSTRALPRFVAGPQRLAPKQIERKTEDFVTGSPSPHRPVVPDPLQYDSLN